MQEQKKVLLLTQSGNVWQCYWPTQGGRTYQCFKGEIR